MHTVPNLDCMSEVELLAFYSKFRRATRKDAESLVGDCRPGYTSICGILAAYAMDRMCAISLRLAGKIQRAMTYEEMMELRYERLPEDLRW